MLGGELGMPVLRQTTGFVISLLAEGETLIAIVIMLTVMLIGKAEYYQTSIVSNQSIHEGLEVGVCG